MRDKIEHFFACILLLAASNNLRADGPDPGYVVCIAHEKHLAISGPGQGDRLRPRFASGHLSGIV